MSVRNYHSVFGLFVFTFLFSVTSFNHGTVSAEVYDAELLKYRNSYLINKGVLKLRDAEALRRFRRGLNPHLDPSSRATETPPSTTTTGPPPPSVNPALLTDSTTVSTVKPTTALPATTAAPVTTAAPTTKKYDFKIPNLPTDFWKNFWKVLKRRNNFNPFG